MMISWFFLRVISAFGSRLFSLTVHSRYSLFETLAVARVALR